MQGTSIYGPQCNGPASSTSQLLRSSPLLLSSRSASLINIVMISAQDSHRRSTGVSRHSADRLGAGAAPQCVLERCVSWWAATSSPWLLEAYLLMLNPPLPPNAVVPPVPIAPPERYRRTLLRRSACLHYLQSTALVAHEAAFLVSSSL